MQISNSICRGLRHPGRGAVRWLALALLLVAGLPASAVERTLMGKSLDMPLSAAADPDTVQTLNTLRRQAATAGSTRVIIGVRVPFAPEGALSASSASQQRYEIADAHAAVLDQVPALQQRPGTIKKFETIPFMALEVTPDELEALVSLPDVTSVEEDKLEFPSLAQSVPLVGGNTGWASGYTGAGQTVAILDTGVDKNHPFLAGKVVSEACYSTNDTASGAYSLCPGGGSSSTAAGSALPYASGVCPAGKCDHGTHVAGIAAGFNGSLAGVAKDASVIAIQVFSLRTGSTNCGVGVTSCVSTYQSDQLLGLERVYALRNSYSIAAINMSLGGGSYSSQSACDSANVSRKAVIDTLRAANIATVIASGNEGYTTSMAAPACISSAVSVGATWDTAYPSGYNCTSKPFPSNYTDYGGVDKVACFSNSVSFLNLLAPGVWINSSVPSSSYSNYPGTSMAAPHVAGAWALLKQKNPAISVTAALAALTSTGVQVTDARNGITKPRIQVNAALAAISSSSGSTLPSAPTNVVAVSGNASASVSFVPGSMGSGALIRYEASCGKVSDGSWNSANLTTAMGTSSPIAVSGLSNGTAYYCWVKTQTTVGYGPWSAESASFTPISTLNLTVTKSGAGTGSVTSAPAGISCGTTCSANYAAGTIVTLTAAPASDSTFSGWSGACTGTSSCVVSMSTAQSVVAVFALPTSTLPSAPTNVVAVAGNASATVSFVPGSMGSGSLIRYEASCGKVSDGSWSSANLTTATGTSSPITVSGLTNGIAYYCWVIPLTTVGYGPWSVQSASFTPTNTLSLTVTKSGAGTGSVSSSPSGISCGTTCSANYVAGTVVTLTAAPASGSTFSGWSGACTGTSSCVVSMSTAQSVVAVFALTTSTLPSAPTNVVAVAGNASATVSFLPGSVGSGAVIRHEASCGKVSDGSWSSTNLTTATGTSSPITVSGLTNGIAYYCWVRTQTTVGYGLWSAESASFTPISTLSAPVCSLSASPSSISPGSSSLLTASCSPAASSYVWTGGTCAGTTAATCTVTPTGTTTYSVAGVNSGGTGTAASASVTVTAPTTRLINLSTRGQVLSGDNVMIGGFIIQGSASKTVLIRAVGPTLANFGVSGVLSDPRLQLFAGQTQIAANDDWQTATNAAAIQATTLAPSNTKESAILTTLAPGAYTAVVSGVGGATGVGIVEVYDIDHPEVPLINISTRGQVQTGDNVMIGGFIIQGTSPQTVLIRAVGPNLANFGVSGVLSDPKLELYSGQSVIASNDNWQTASNAAAIQATTLAPVDPREAAILITLQPGAYTAVVSGANGGVGVGIIEVFAR